MCAIALMQFNFVASSNEIRRLVCVITHSWEIDISADLIPLLLVMTQVPILIVGIPLHSLLVGYMVLLMLRSLRMLC